jgi:hypothetical protein
MTVVLGDLLALDVESTTPGVFLPVADMNRFSSTTAQERTTFGRFQGAPVATYGQATKSLSFAGLLNPDDVGQQRLRDVLAAKTTVKVRVYPDTDTDGYEVTVRVLSITHGASAEAGTLQDGGFECEAVSAATPIGAGHVV